MIRFVTKYNIVQYIFNVTNDKLSIKPRYTKLFIYLYTY